MFIDILKEKVKNNLKKIILPEGEDVRTLKASEYLSQNNLVEKIFLVGDEAQILKVTNKEEIDISKCEVVNINKFDKLSEFEEEYFNLRKHKGVTHEIANKQVKNYLNFGALFVRFGYADGMVAGAVSTTADVSRAAVTIVKPKSTIRYVSSSFIMDTPKSEYGDNGVFVYSDCGLIPDPTAEQLKDISIAAAHTAKHICSMDPKLALLSFSTIGSANHPVLEKVKQAKQLLDKENVDFTYDGEMQLDAAIVPTVAKKKCPNSPISGKANVLIFPDLNSGNIGYKLTERLAGARAY